MRCGGSAVGHQVSGPPLSVKRSSRLGMGMRVSSMPVIAVRNTTSLGCVSGRPAWRSLSATPSWRKRSMVREATWLHFTLGGSLYARSSAMVTRTPRPARSMASVRPTGPAPTMSTSVLMSIGSGMGEEGFIRA